jgi:putative cell wall-binding protein
MLDNARETVRVRIARTRLLVTSPMPTKITVPVRILLAGALLITLAPTTVVRAATISDDTTAQLSAGTTSGSRVMTRDDGEITLSVTTGNPDTKVNGAGTTITIPRLSGAFDNVPRVVTDKFGTLYAVFTGTVGGVHSVYFAGSRDGGVTWDGNLLTSAIDAPTILPKDTTQASDNNAATLPDIAVDDSVSPPRAYVAFLDDRGADAFGNAGLSGVSDVYVTSMTPGTSGASWTTMRMANSLTTVGRGAANIVGSATNINGGPRIALSPVTSDVYVTWNNDPSVSGDYNVYFTKANRSVTDGMFVFDTEVRIDDNSASTPNNLSVAPSMAVDKNGKVYIAYEDTRDSAANPPNSEVRLAAFTPTSPLTAQPASIEVHSDPGGAGVTDAFISSAPEIAVSSAATPVVIIAFEQEQSGPAIQTLVSRSTDGGTTFPAGNETVLLGADTHYPDVAIDTYGDVVVVREDTTSGEVISNISSDSGLTYGTNTTIPSGASTTSYLPSVAVNLAGDAVALWVDDRESSSIWSGINLGSVTTWDQRYGTNGTFTSRVIDLGDDSANPGNFMADRVVLGGGFSGATASDLKFQFRGGTSTTDIASQPFTGSDGSASSFYTGTSVQAQEATSTNLDGKRYLQYQATLTNINGGATSGLTPTFRSVSVDFGGDAPMTRLAGADRYKSAVAIANNRFTSGSANSLVITTGEVFADALPGGPLAGILEGPLLITRRDSLPPDVAGAITNLLKADTGDTDVYLLGGPAAVSTTVENAIKALRSDIGLKRIGGGNRVETSKLVADEMDSIRTSLGMAPVSAAFLSRKDNFPDALAAASPGASKSVKANYMSVLLTGGDALDPTIKTYLQSKAASLTNLYVTGGTAAIKDAVVSDADSVVGVVERLAGSDRYATAIEIGKKFYVGALLPTCISVPTGENFPDALTGGPHAGSKNCPIVMTKKANIPGPSSTYVSSNAASIGGGFVYGGTSVVPDSIKSAFESLY